MFDKNKVKFGVLGTVQLLVKAIEDSFTFHDSDNVHHFLSSLAELVQFPYFGCESRSCSRSSSNCEEHTDNEDLAGTSLSVLGLLVRFDEGLNGLKKSDWIIGLLLSVLKGRSLLSKEGATDILVRLFDESEECVREALVLHDFSRVLADVSMRRSARMRDKAELRMRTITKVSLEANNNNNKYVPIVWLT